MVGTRIRKITIDGTHRWGTQVLYKSAIASGSLSLLAVHVARHGVADDVGAPNYCGYKSGAGIFVSRNEQPRSHKCEAYAAETKHALADLVAYLWPRYPVVNKAPLKTKTQRNNEQM